MMSVESSDQVLSIFSRELSICDCFDNNLEFDVFKYIIFRRQQSRKRIENELRERRNQSNVSHSLIYIDEDGRRRMPKLKRRVYVRKDFTQSVWWTYVLGGTYADPNHPHSTVFRLRFRVPWDLYKRLVDEIRELEWFSENPDAAGRPSSSLELKILGVLRVLGRAFTFDDLEEVTLISKEVHRNFFHQFIRKFATHYYPLKVKPPSTEADIRSAMSEYTKAGFPGAIGSTDCVHVWWDRCSASEKVLSTGKEKYPTRVYEMTVNHRRQIYSTTGGDFGSYNDKTVVKFDGFVQKVHKGELYQDVMWFCFNKDGQVEPMKGE